MSNKRCFGCMQLKENSPVCEHCGFNENVQNESHQLPMGTVLRGQYMVGKCLGQGGFGITYLGWDLHLDIPVAIKEYYPNSIVNRDATHNPALTGVATNMMDLYVSTRQRFLREAKVLAKLRNIPNIVQVHNFFEENNTAYIVMEYVKGIDLRRYMNMRGGRLSVEETLAILRPVMEALARVHDCEIVHRDISPDNIMMMADGTAKLLDFGAVRNIESMDADQDLQRSTEAILKHGFAPMEQYQKRGALGPWTDEYAMCATVYYCLTGRVPPDAPQRMMEDVHPAWEKIPGLSSSQRMVLEKGMSLRGKDRYPNVRELMAALYGQEPQPAAEPIQATKPVQPMEMPAPGPVEEAEVPAYTAPMMTAPVEHVELPVQKKKKSGGLIIAAVALIAALAAGALMLGGNKSKPQMQAPETQAPAITTEAPETTAPVETTEATTAPTEAWKANVLMRHHQDYKMGADTVPAFGTDITKVQVKTITFRDSTAGAPARVWDASETQDGSVLVWYEGNDYYKDLIIAADGGINAKNTACMFSEYQSLESVDFGTAFHTDYAVSFDEMFYCCTRLKAVDLSSFQTGNVTDLSCMFDYCRSLAEVDVSGWDTSNVTNVACMFRGCKSLKELDTSGWDISKAEYYYWFMDDGDTINGQPWEEFFKNPPKAAAPAANVDSDAWRNNVLIPQYASENQVFGTPITRDSIQSITFLDTLKDAPEANIWDVSVKQNGSVMAWVYQNGDKYDMYIGAEGGINAKYCEQLFYNFASLERIDFGNAFHTDEATSMNVMFWSCSQLTDFDVTCFNTGNVKSMCAMFECCNLTKLDLSSWDTSNVVDMSSMFSNNQHNLTEINLSNWDVSNVTNMSYMFNGSYAIKELDLSGWDISNVKHYNSFMNSGDTINGQPWEEFFKNPPKAAAPAANVDSDAWRNNVLMAQTEGSTKYQGDMAVPAFGTPIPRGNIQSITFLDSLKDAPEANIWDVSEKQDGSVMAWVYQNGNMYDMYIAGEGGINAKNCEDMFLNFRFIKSIDFGDAFHTDEATGMANMFKNCQQLCELDVSGFNTARVTDMSMMFNHCFSLETVNVEYLDMSNVTSTYGMFSMHVYQQNSDGTFASAEVRGSALKRLDVSNWDMSNVTNMYSMFSDCTSLEYLDVSNWDVSNVTSMNSTFRNCGLLRNLDVRNWDVSNVQDYKAFAPDGALINGMTVWALFNS